MPDYRIYVLTEEGRITTPPRLVTADTDQAAIRRARHLLDGSDVEVWEGPRLVRRIKAVDR
jgi:hypothetical protein